MPPGTGDVAISVGQLLPHAEVLVVTTPQRAAADVAERSAMVARQTGQTVIGVVENMAGLAQADGSVLELFGSGGGAETAARLEVPLLAQVPLSIALREGGDEGRPIVLEADDPAGAAIRALAQTVAARGRGLAGRIAAVQPPLAEASRGRRVGGVSRGDGGAQRFSGLRSASRACSALEQRGHPAVAIADGQHGGTGDGGDREGGEGDEQGGHGGGFLS